MREIKFRMWNDYDKKMINWNEMCKQNLPNIFRIPSYGQYLMQYTGLKDKNGKEIYEGDIVSNGYEKCIVVWVKDYAGFMLKLINKDYENREWTNPIIDLTKNDEVIGNVWEDSDLLNDSKNTKSN